MKTLPGSPFCWVTARIVTRAEEVQHDLMGSYFLPSSPASTALLLSTWPQPRHWLLTVPWIYHVCCHFRAFRSCWSRPLGCSSQRCSLDSTWRSLLKIFAVISSLNNLQNKAAPSSGFSLFTVLFFLFGTLTYSSYSCLLMLGCLSR